MSGLQFRVQIDLSETLLGLLFPTKWPTEQLGVSGFGKAEE